MHKLRNLSRRHLVILAVAIGMVAGTVLFVAYRMATYKSTNIHHHANFALYINGQRDEFKSFTFYEEVQACVDHGVTNPKSRVHLHNQDASLVHVHDGGVTWGHFFANLGYGLTDDVVQTDDGIFTTNDTNKLEFILNGQEVDAIANRVISSEDALLINYGNDDEVTLDQRYKSINHNAHEFNGKYDPGGCSGDEELTLGKRFRAALGIEEQH
jgi:hypothetical protein